MAPSSPRHAYHRISPPLTIPSRSATVSPLSSLPSLRSVSTRATHSVRRKPVSGGGAVSPLSDTYEEEDGPAVLAAASAGVPFLGLDMELSSTQNWGTPARSRAFSVDSVGSGGRAIAGRSRGFSVDSVGSGGRTTGGRSRGFSGSVRDGERDFEDFGGVYGFDIREEGEEEGGRDEEGSKAEVNEAALESGWRPGYLRRRVVISFIAAFAALAIMLEVLAAVDQARGSLGSGGGRVSVLWGYLPTIIVVIVAALWGRLEFQAKRYMPWILLAGQGSPRDASDALFLDYANASLPTALRTSMRKKHFLVLGPLIISLVLLVEVVLSTGVFIRLDVGVEREMPAMVRDRFVVDGDVGGLEEVPGRDPYAVMLGIARGGMAYPEGYTPGLAYQTFDLPETAGDSSFQMGVETLSVRPECEVGKIEEDTAGTQASFTVGSSACGGGIPVSLASGSADEEQYHFVYKDLEGEEGCSGDEPLVLAGVFQVRSASDGGLTHTDSAAVVCKVPFYSGRRDVTLRPDAEPAITPATGDDKLLEQSLLDPIHDSLGSNGTFTPVVTGEDYMTDELPPPFVLAAHLARSGPPPADDFLDGMSLGNMMEGFLDNFGPLAAHYTLREDNPKLSSGTATTTEQRLRVASGIAHSMTALFMLSLLMAIPLILHVPRRGVTPQCPNSVAGTAVLLVNSEDIFERLRGADTGSLAAIEERLRGSYYSAVELMGPVMRKFVLKRMPDGTPDAPPNSPARKPQGYNPWVLRALPRIISIVLAAALAAALWGLIAASNNNQGLAPVHDAYTRSVLWTCLPAAAVVGLGAYLKSADFQTRFLAPFSALYSADGFAAGMTTTYTDELAPVTVYKAVREKSWAVVLAKGAAVMASVMPILVCRLYTPEDVLRETEMEVTQVEWFEERSDGPPLVDLAANNASYPWVHDNLVVPRVEVEGSTRDATIEARLPAVRAELTCKPIKPSDDDISTVECELLDGERTVMCDAGQANDFFAHAATRCISKSTGEEFEAFMHYLWGSCDGGEQMGRRVVSCEERVVEVEARATMRGEPLGVVSAEEYAGSRRETDIDLPREKVYDGLRGEADPWFDAFFTLLSHTTPLKPSTPVSTLTSAIEKQHATLRGQALTASRTPTTAHHKGTRTEKTTRLVQHGAPTHLLAVALTLAFGASAAAAVTAPARALPCSPGCVGAVAGMLAEWGMRVVPVGAEWMGDATLRRYFEGG